MSLNTSIYDGKREYAAKMRVADSEIETLTPEQHDTLAWLCTIRHEIHSNQDSLFLDESADHVRFWNYIDKEINEKLKECGLETIDFGDTDESYITDSIYSEFGMTREEAEISIIRFAE